MKNESSIPEKGDETMEMSVNAPEGNECLRMQLNESTVNRMVEEQNAAIHRYIILGLEAGQAYAEKASYLDVKYVAQHFDPINENDYFVPPLVFSDSVIGEVFREAFNGDPYLDCCYDGPDTDSHFINLEGLFFIKAFTIRVSDFWSEVSSKLGIPKPYKTL